MISLRRVLVAAAVAGVLPALAAAQQTGQPTVITGRVTTAGGGPLEAASVSIAAIGVGIYTRADGRYTLTVPAGRSQGQALAVTARRIGFEPKSVQLTPAGGTITQDFELVPAPTEIQGVVTTALGGSENKSQVGTSIQQVTSSDLTQTKGQSITDQLEGKVSGVDIVSTGIPGGSTMITVRGFNSMTGDNTPLFVIDGVPALKQDYGVSSQYGGWDFGNAVNDLNPDDIETLTVLKGPNAAALYGSRAANGVILITTKKGANSAGAVRTELNTYYTAETPSILPTYQNSYGQGAGGAFMWVDGAGGGVNDGADQSWGPRLDGRTTGCTFQAGTDFSNLLAVPHSAYDSSAPCLQFTSPHTASPWIAHPNNVQDFFQTGHTASGTIAVSGGTDRANARLSAGQDNMLSYVPGTQITKSNIMFAGNLQATDKLSTSATISYLRDAGFDRPGQGYGASPIETFVWFGRQVDINALKDNFNNSATLNGGPAGREFNWNYNYHNNPYFTLYDNPESDARDRVTGNISATYKLADWLNVTGRTGEDLYRFNVSQEFTPADITCNSTFGNVDACPNPSYAGSFGNSNIYQSEMNSEALLSANKALSRIVLNGNLGGNVRQQYFNQSSIGTTGISAPGIYNIANAAVAPTAYQQLIRQQVNSVYGSASYTWDGWWTVEGTARNDWSSTLPAGQNSYFYPSGNTSIILTDAIPSLKNKVLSYLKLRGSIAQVGNDAPPYQLQSVYNGSSTKFSGQPLFGINSTIADPLLKPEITRSSEAGLEANFFSGRVTFDGSFYDKLTRNQIFSVPVSPATGFSSAELNAGEIKNEGFEGLMSVVPIQASNGFQWTSTFNYSTNASRVVSLYPGITNITLGGTWYVNVEARTGQAYGDLYGNAFLRDSATGKLMVNGGLTQAGPQKVLGSIIPHWIGGWSNQFTYKHITVSTLVDMHIGGNLWSITNWFGDYSGVLKSSLVGREVDWNNPGYLVKGLDMATCGSNSHYDAAGMYVCQGGTANTTMTTSELYFQDIFPVNEGYVYQDSWVKFRELRVGVDLPQKWATRFNASAMNLAVIGRNLWLWSTVPNVDPEQSYGTGNGVQGIEYASFPEARQIGLSLRITP